MSLAIATSSPAPKWISHGKNVLLKGVRWTKVILDKHTDLIHNLGIIAISTCLLAAKIFKNMPSYLPRVSNFVFNFGGIIWLNVQVVDFLKSCRDVSHAIKERDIIGLVETSAKVAVKGVDVLLTITIFSASMLMTLGYPEITLAVYLAIRPIALASLAVMIASDVRDYFVNRKIIADLKNCENSAGISLTAQKVTNCFHQIVTKGSVDADVKGAERSIAYRLLRQFHASTVNAYKEGLSRENSNPTELYQIMKQSLIETQAYTEDNLKLRALGYVSMGICKAWPETIIEKSSRLGMSLLYTALLIRKKIEDAQKANELIKLNRAA